MCKCDRTGVHGGLRPTDEDVRFTDGLKEIGHHRLLPVPLTGGEGIASVGMFNSDGIE